MRTKKIETVEQYLARGGRIQSVPFGVATIRETGSPKSAKSSRDRMKQMDTARIEADRHED